MPFALLVLALLILALLILGGCGYVGPVLPPSTNIPMQITDLAAVERGDQIFITFRTPMRTTDGLAVARFSAIDLRIGVASLPFDFSSWAEAATPYTVALPPPLDPLDPQQIAMSQNVPAAKWIGKRVAIAVRTSAKRGDDHVSQWSNRVVLNVVPPLDSPQSLKVEKQPQGVMLKWSAVGSAKGYRILRQSAVDKTPQQVGTTETNSFLDKSAQFENTYTYSVIATNDEAESEPFVVRGVEFLDVFPPSAPSGLTILAAPESLELSWQRSPDSKVLGYYVYRAAGGGDFVRQGELANLPAFSDKRVERGKTYKYRVTAVDKKNLESQPSNEVDATF